MKINKYWAVEKAGSRHTLPDFVERVYANEAYAFTPKQKQDFNENYTVIHYNDDEFTPIALGPKYVVSEGTWRIKEFYRSLITVLSLEDCQTTDDARWSARRYGNTYNWGCRTFKRKQLLLIKRTMESEYTKEKLGANNTGNDGRLQ